MRTATFFEDIEFGGRNKVRNFVLEEESISIPEPIHIVASDEASPEPLQDIVVQSTIQDELVVHEEQTQDLQEPLLQESVHLRQSTRERRSAIPDDYIVFLQEHEENDDIMKNDPISFHQAMQDSNLEK